MGVWLGIFFSQGVAALYVGCAGRTPFSFPLWIARFRTYSFTINMKKKALPIITLIAVISVTGCETVPSSPGLGVALMQSVNQSNQQFQQQMQDLNRQTFENQEAANRQFQQQNYQQQMLHEMRQSRGQSVYNSATGQYQYVPPGWHSVWDSQRNTWIIQP